MPWSLSRRKLVQELMDAPDVDVRDLATSLRFLAWTNSYLGGTRAVLGALEVQATSWGPGEPLRFLDVGTGLADIPDALSRWAHARGHPARVVGLDLHAGTLACARSRPPLDRRLPSSGLVRGDALELPFGDRSFDYSLSSCFLHHLDDAEVVRCLVEMKRVARRGVVIADLERSFMACLAVRLLTLVAGDRITRHDGPVSVRRALTTGELAGLAHEAGLPSPLVTSSFPCRLTLVSMW